MVNLGEQICKYRTARGLSQLELAEKLEVSRQSISKWETNVAVPELEKLVKMAEFFEITLDELILDQRDPVVVEQEKMIEETVHKTVAEVKKEERATSVVKIVFGVLFLILGFWLTCVCLWAGAWLEILVYVTPCIISAVFCLKQFRFAALWCLETWYIAISVYLLEATGITWSDILHTQQILSLPTANPIRVLTAWILAICLAGLIALTVFAYRKHDFLFSKAKRSIFLIGTGAIFPLKNIISAIVQQIVFACYGGVDAFYTAQNTVARRWVSAFLFLLDIAAYAAFTVFLVPTFYYLRDLIRENRAYAKKSAQDEE